MPGIHLDSDQPLSDLNVTPLVDVLLVLLVMVMLIVPTHLEVIATKSSASQANTTAQATAQILSLHVDGRWEFNGQPYAHWDGLASVLNRLQMAQRARGQTLALSLRPEAAVSYEALLNTVAKLQALGIEQLDFSE